MAADHVIPPPEPEPGVDPERVAEDLAELTEVISTGIEVDGQVTQVGESTWAIYGHSSYDGEVIVGEYPDPVEAAEVLEAAPHLDAHPPDPDSDGPLN